MPEVTKDTEQKKRGRKPAVVYSNQGVPFNTEAKAREFMTEQNYDSSEWQIYPHDGGYVIKPRPKKEPEKYFKVIFSPRQSASEDEDVILAVNGDVLVIQRGVETIIPGRFKECADHTTIPIFTQKPNESRKEVGNRMLFPYTVICETSEKDYKKMLAEGNKKTKEALATAQKLVS